MAHNKRCESAGQPGCSCPCGGVDHGVDALNVAAGPRQVAIDLRTQAAATYRSVVEEGATAGRRATTQANIEDVALCRWIVSDIVVYLNGHQDFLTITRSVADSLSASVRSVFEEQFSNEQRKTLPKGHFWCALLAALAETLDRFEGQWEQASKQVRDLVVERLYSKPFVKRTALSWLSDELIRTTVHLLWSSIDKAARNCAGIDQFRTSTRVLGLMLCPDMSRHPEVIRWCLAPLHEEFLSQKLADLVTDWIDVRHGAFSTRGTNGGNS